MVVIKLFCSAGMSTSMLVTKMRKSAIERGIDADIEALPEANISKCLEDMDVALLGPQVRYMLPTAKKFCEPKGIPVAIIPTVDYGMLNGEKVLDFALKLIEDNK
ncbi:MAG: PTS sugar transporter subunit IIB [Clostridiaceae bacterium]